MKPLLVSSGEPAGIGPDLCLKLASSTVPLVVLGDRNLLDARARELNLAIDIADYERDKIVEPGCISVLSIPCASTVQCGTLNPDNAQYVLELLAQGAARCASGEFSALVTAPIQKAIINEAGIPFSGHTEFFAHYFNVDDVVMMLACEKMRVALVTTHLPLKQVPAAITIPQIEKVIRQLNNTLMRDFGIKKPKIKVAGLNPHAGESGYLGREEIDIISPALDGLRKEAIDVAGPLSADTLFVLESGETCDAFVAMYHDQGLPVLKYAGFNHSVNVTLGLPIIRTSVDHGTALDLAGKNKADAGSLLAAVSMAHAMALTREEKCAQLV